MMINKLKLNTDKTELAVFYSKFRAKPDLFSIKVGDQIIHPKKSLRNIGAIFDETVSMLPQVNSICKHIKLCFVVLKAWVEKQCKLSNLVLLSAGLGQRRSINKQNGGLGYLTSG